MADTKMSEKSYIDHNFPVILHTAKPIRLDDSLKGKLDAFIPKAIDRLGQLIVERGRSKKEFIFFRAHHIAIVLLPQKVFFCLDDKNATLFMSAFYCFELKSEVSTQEIRDILQKHFDMKSPLLFEVPREFVESPKSISEEDLMSVVARWFDMEEKEIGEAVGLKISPKVFSSIISSVRLGYCFVLMPFSEALTEVYEDCIKAAILELGMKCKRADDIFHNTSIMEVIWTEICSSEIIIADLTDKNANVFYELGIAHTLGKETILITQDPEFVPFDLRHLKYIEYKNTGRGLKDLKQNIKATIRGIRGGGEAITSHE